MLTNSGPLNNKLEKKLCNYFKVKYLCLTSSGTSALEIAIKTLDIKKGVLCSPFSYVATPNAANWMGLKTFFCDIEKKNLSLDLKKLKNSYKNKFDCILSTHVFGVSSNFAKILKFSKNTNIKTIYDASHCFGLNYKKKSILKNGDASILSFHATKVFNTCEGGAVIFRKKNITLKLKN